MVGITFDLIKFLYQDNQHAKHDVSITVLEIFFYLQGCFRLSLSPFVYCLRPIPSVYRARLDEPTRINCRESRHVSITQELR